MKQSTIKNTTVTANDILSAMKDFDKTYPDTNGYEAWLEQRQYKFAVEHQGRLYPCKYILSQATGIDTGEFSGGAQTNRVFGQLGFNVIEKPAR
jgi:hypothetical protein